VKAVTESDAILFGATGSPEYAAIPPEHNKFDQLLRMRKELDLFINLRPVRAIKALAAASHAQTRGVWKAPTWS